MVDPIDGQGAKLNIFKKSIFIEISIEKSKKKSKNTFSKKYCWMNEVVVSAKNI